VSKVCQILITAIPNAPLRRKTPKGVHHGKGKPDTHPDTEIDARGDWGVLTEEQKTESH